MLFRSAALPPTTSHRYHSKKKDIWNHMWVAAVKLKFSKLNQENFELKIKEWQKLFPKDSFYFPGYGSINEETLHLVKEKDSACNLVQEKEVVVRTLYPFKWDFKLAMHNVPKWSGIFQKFCTIFCKIFKVFLTILEHYVLKAWCYFNRKNSEPVLLFTLLI